VAVFGRSVLRGSIVNLTVRQIGHIWQVNRRVLLGNCGGRQLPSVGSVFRQAGIVAREFAVGIGDGPVPFSAASMR